ncbi:hypothetical protein SAMN06295888_11878 [Desulfonatronum zhilinae]|nr:hypothetical protein SAMN06295888_11878 [Desulfonatronum zhilinae]
MAYYLILYLAITMAAAGQVLLKHGADKGGLNLGILRLNLWVVLGFLAMGGSMLMGIRALSVVPLRDMAFILPAVFIFVPVFARVFLGERISRATMIGTMIILAGMVVFHLPLGWPS